MSNVIRAIVILFNEFPSDTHRNLSSVDIISVLVSVYKHSNLDSTELNISNALCDLLTSTSEMIEVSISSQKTASPDNKFVYNLADLLPVYFDFVGKFDWESVTTKDYNFVHILRRIAEDCLEIIQKCIIPLGKEAIIEPSLIQEFIHFTDSLNKCQDVSLQLASFDVIYIFFKFLLKYKSAEFDEEKISCTTPWAAKLGKCLLQIKQDPNNYAPLAKKYLCAINTDNNILPSISLPSIYQVIPQSNHEDQLLLSEVSVTFGSTHICFQDLQSEVLGDIALIDIDKINILANSFVITCKQDLKSKANKFPAKTEKFKSYPNNVFRLVCIAPEEAFDIINNFQPIQNLLENEVKPLNSKISGVFLAPITKSFTTAKPAETAFDFLAFASQKENSGPIEPIIPPHQQPCEPSVESIKRTLNKEYDAFEYKEEEDTESDKSFDFTNKNTKGKKVNVEEEEKKEIKNEEIDEEEKENKKPVKSRAAPLSSKPKSTKTKKTIVNKAAAALTKADLEKSVPLFKSASKSSKNSQTVEKKTDSKRKKPLSKVVNQVQLKQLNESTDEIDQFVSYSAANDPNMVTKNMDEEDDDDEVDTIKESKRLEQDSFERRKSSRFNNDKDEDSGKNNNYNIDDSSKLGPKSTSNNKNRKKEGGDENDDDVRKIRVKSFSQVFSTPVNVPPVISKQKMVNKKNNNVEEDEDGNLDNIDNNDSAVILDLLNNLVTKSQKKEVKEVKNNIIKKQSTTQKRRFGVNLNDTYAHYDNNNNNKFPSPTKTISSNSESYQSQEFENEEEVSPPANKKFKGISNNKIKIKNQSQLDDDEIGGTLTAELLKVVSHFDSADSAKKRKRMEYEKEEYIRKLDKAIENKLARVYKKAKPFIDAKLKAIAEVVKNYISKNMFTLLKLFSLIVRICIFLIKYPL